MSKIRVLVVKTWEIFCGGLVKLLQSESGIDVVSVSNMVSPAVKAARAHKPDVVIADIQSSKDSSAELIQHIHEVVPDAHIVVLTHSTKMADFFSAVKAGATGYISKGSSYKSIVKTIVLAAEGKLIIDPPMAEIVIRGFKVLDEYRHGAQLNLLNTLSKQERAVLALMAHDATNSEIASALFITKNTVKIHVRTIMHKLHAHHRLAAMACAIEDGMQFSEDGTGAEHMQQL